jgi:hypothetical protein
METTMIRRLSSAPLTALVAACAVTSLLQAVSANAADAAAPSGPEARIAFANHGGIRDWQADGDKAIYVQDIHGKWYHAQLMGFCTDLPFVEHVGFVSEPNGDFNRMSAIVVRGQQCPVKTFTASGAPPSKHPKVKPAQPAAEGTDNAQKAEGTDDTNGAEETPKQQ